MDVTTWQTGPSGRTGSSVSSQAVSRSRSVSVKASPHLDCAKLRLGRSPFRSWLKEVAPASMPDRLHTLERSNESSGWLKEVAPASRPETSVTLVRLRKSSGWLNEVAPLNRLARLTALEVSQLSGELKVWYGSGSGSKGGQGVSKPPNANRMQCNARERDGTQRNGTQRNGTKQNDTAARGPHSTASTYRQALEDAVEVGQPTHAPTSDIVAVKAEQVVEQAVHNAQDSSEETPEKTGRGARAKWQRRAAADLPAHCGTLHRRTQLLGRGEGLERARHAAEEVAQQGLRLVGHRGQCLGGEEEGEEEARHNHASLVCRW